MYFLYVDESGDPSPYDPTQAQPCPSQHYILTGLIVLVGSWRNYLSSLVEIRRYVKKQYGIGVRAELKGAALINPRGSFLYKHLRRNQRVALYRDVFNMVVARLPAARILPLHLNKQQPKHPNVLQGKDPDEVIWTWLLQRFNTFLKRQNNSNGLIFADQTNEIKIRRILRRMRVYNYVPSQYGGYYADPVIQIIEDPVMRDSKHSYFIQMADLTAHALYRKLYPKGGYRKFNVDRLFDELKPLLVLEAARDDPYQCGIKHL